MTKRKIVQIAVVPGQTGWPAAFVGLCDNGDVLVIQDKAGAAWEQLPPIPQPEPASQDLERERAFRRSDLWMLR